MELFVWNSEMTEKIPASVSPATQDDYEATKGWQTSWTAETILDMPNRVALHRGDTAELLGLMSYTLDETGLAVEIIYLESAGHSNMNLLRQYGGTKKYIGIAKALFAYAASVSLEAGYDGVIYFKAKTSKLREYYMRQFGARPLGSYDPFRLVIWEDAAQKLIEDFS